MEEFQLGLNKIDDLVKEFYKTISFTKTEGFDFDRFKLLFKPDARLVYFSGDNLDYLKVDTFIFRLKEQVENGKFPSFYEYELARKEDRFGKIANVFSTYEAKETQYSTKVLHRGINSMQMILDNSRWWITGLAWFEENLLYPIPEKYLPIINIVENGK